MDPARAFGGSPQVLHGATALAPGRALPVQELVIHPFDARPVLRHSTYQPRSAWPLRTIDVL